MLHDSFSEGSIYPLRALFMVAVTAMLLVAFAR